jgi:hypothetical protein
MAEAERQFDRYVIESLLGEGGMGQVYRARDERLHRRVALKVLRPAHGSAASAGDGARAGTEDPLLREARAAAALDHPNTVAIYDVGEAHGTPFIAMELVEGRPLRAVVGDATTPIDTRVRYLVDIAKALQAAHARGILHRDVKPENVIVRHDGVVKVLDFGVARSLEAPHDGEEPEAANDAGPPSIELRAAHAFETFARSGIWGTPRYMAPEQLDGKPLDARTDQFAWGVLAYELLTGRPPWGAGSSAVTLALIAAIVSDEPAPSDPLLGAAPAGVAATVLRALSKRREDRFRSMADVIAALSREVRERERENAIDAPAPAGPRGRVKLAALEPGIEVYGRLVNAVVAGFGTSRAVAEKFLRNFGAASVVDDVTEDHWISQEVWLRAFDAIIEHVGGGVLFNTGLYVPVTARGWPESPDIVHALRTLDVVYHANHRKEGRAMLDPVTGAMHEGIGHYRISGDPAEGLLLVHCDHPYPCELDLGILTSIARRYEAKATIEHLPIGCRTIGAAVCTYSVRWG